MTFDPNALDRHITGNYGEDQYRDPGDGFEVEAEEICPACGNTASYCQGHGEIGDPVGFRIVIAHYQDTDHEDCHRLADCPTDDEKQAAEEDAAVDAHYRRIEDEAAEPFYNSNHYDITKERP